MKTVKNETKNETVEQVTVSVSDVEEKHAVMHYHISGIRDAAEQIVEKFAKKEVDESWVTGVENALGYIAEKFAEINSASSVNEEEIEKKNRAAFELSAIFVKCNTLAKKWKQVDSEGNMLPEAYADAYEMFDKPHSTGNGVGKLHANVSIQFRTGKYTLGNNEGGPTAATKRVRDEISGKEGAAYDIFLYGWRQDNANIVKEMPKELQFGNYNKVGGKTVEWLDENGYLPEGTKVRGYLQKWADCQEVDGKPQFTEIG